MRAFLLLRLLLFVVSFRCQVSPTGPTRIAWKQSVLQLHKGKPLTQTTLMKWFPFQSDCATLASDWLPARYPLEIQGTDQPAGTDCDSRDCGRLPFFLCLSDQNAAQNLCSEINSLSLHHRRVLCTLCIIKYVHSFKKKKQFPNGGRERICLKCKWAAIPYSATCTYLYLHDSNADSFYCLPAVKLDEKNISQRTTDVDHLNGFEPFCWPASSQQTAAHTSLNQFCKLPPTPGLFPTIFPFFFSWQRNPLKAHSEQLVNNSKCRQTDTCCVIEIRLDFCRKTHAEDDWRVSRPCPPKLMGGGRVHNFISSPFANPRPYGSCVGIE